MRKPRPLPLFDRPEPAPLQDLRPPLRRLPVALLAAGLASLAATIVLPPVPRLIWNASASAPVGLYAVTPRAPLQRGDMVFAWPPPAARDLAASRHYLPRNVPLLKRIVASAGDRICARDFEVTVNGRPVAVRRPFDRMGRPLPAWQGCIHLHADQHFLLMTDSPDSFDGRYFGATQAPDLIGRATPLWLP